MFVVELFVFWRCFLSVVVNWFVFVCCLLLVVGCYWWLRIGVACCVLWAVWLAGVYYSFSLGVICCVLCVAVRCCVLFIVSDSV